MDYDEATDQQHDDVEAEAQLQFSETSEVGEGMCSCVCISDEQCCGCILQ